MAELVLLIDDDKMAIPLYKAALRHMASKLSSAPMQIGPSSSQNEKSPD